MIKYNKMGGSLTEEEIFDIKKYFPGIKFFVETGTYKADTSILASKYFEKVFTTEIHKGLHEYSKKRADESKIDNINFLLGNSIELLPEILEEIMHTECDCIFTPLPVDAVFFLDAHISGNDSSWNGKELVPLLEELDVILKYRIGQCVFILDDIRFWKGHYKEAPDWNHIDNNVILSKFKENDIYVKSIFEKNDRLFLIIDGKYADNF